MTQTHTVEREEAAPGAKQSAAQDLSNKIQLLVFPGAISIARNEIFQIVSGLMIWFGFVAFLCLTDAGLDMAGDMTLLVLAAWNIFADVLHLPRAPYSGF